MFLAADIVKHVLKEYRNIYPEIMKRVERTLEQVHAAQEVPHSRTGSAHMVGWM